MAAFDSGAFDSGAFDGQPPNQIDTSGFDAALFGTLRIGDILPDGSVYESFGTASAAVVIYGTGFETSAVGDQNAQWRKYVDTSGIYYDTGFGLGVVRNSGEPDTPQQLDVPYFIGESFGARRVYHLAGMDTTLGSQTLFGDLTHRTWIFTAGETLQFGVAGVAHPMGALPIKSDFVPHPLALTYAFNPGSGIFTSGIGSTVSKPYVANLISVPQISASEFGAAGVAKAIEPLPIWSTRFPSTHTTVKYPFGYSPFVEPDTFVATLFGTPNAASAVSEIGLTTGGMGDVGVLRYNPPALRVRDGKNTTLKFDGVPFQWGFPKRDIFTVGIKPGLVGDQLRLPRVIQPTGKDQSVFWNWWYPEVQQRIQYLTWPWTGYYNPWGGTVSGPTLTNTGQHGIRPKGFVATGFQGTSLFNSKLSAHPAGSTHVTFGTPTLTKDLLRQTVYAQPVGVANEVVPHVWHVRAQYLGPVQPIPPANMPAIQCALLDPDFYQIESFQDDGYGIPLVRRGMNIRPASLDTLWGDAQVTHYTRRVYQWQPWSETVIGDITRFVQRTYIEVDGFHREPTFGDAHRWEENLIRLRTWDSGGVGTPRTVQIVAPEGVSGDVGEYRLVWPLYADTFWTQEMGAVAVGLGNSYYCCGMLARAVIPKPFASTQFGDFNALL